MMSPRSGTDDAADHRIRLDVPMSTQRRLGCEIEQGMVTFEIEDGGRHDSIHCRK